MTDSTPTPSPAPAEPTSPAEKLTLKTALTDVTIVVGALVTGGEAILVAVPSGPANTALQIALPILVAISAGLRKLGG